MNDNPLCDTNPNAAGGRTLQKYAKGYPGIRELAVVQGLKTQGIVGSIRPAHMHRLPALDFGYRPAVGAIIDAEAGARRPVPAAPAHA